MKVLDFRQQTATHYMMPELTCGIMPRDPAQQKLDTEENCQWVVVYALTWLDISKEDQLLWPSQEGTVRATIKDFRAIREERSAVAVYELVVRFANRAEEDL